MFRKIPTTPRSADRSCNRIEFVPSLAATAALVIWLALAVTLILVSDLHWAARLAASSAVAGVVLTTGWSFILLRGPRAIRALDWLDHDPAAFLISLGSADRRVPAIPRDAADTARSFGYCDSKRTKASANCWWIPVARSPGRCAGWPDATYGGTERRNRVVRTVPRRLADTIRPQGLKCITLR
jgi:hypothetical protein